MSTARYTVEFVDSRDGGDVTSTSYNTLSDALDTVRDVGELVGLEVGEVRWDRFDYYDADGTKLRLAHWGDGTVSILLADRQANA